MGIGGLVASPAEAQAAGWDRCQHGTYCLFEDADGLGRMYVLGNPVSGGRYNIDAWFNDKATSLWNRSGKSISLFSNSGCRAYLMNAQPYGGPQNLPWDLNDYASSACVIG
jgi:hypothetical protein